MRANTKDPKSTALCLYRQPQLQVALPLCLAQGRPSLEEGARAEAVAALARVLLEAAGVASTAEVVDDP